MVRKTASPLAAITRRRGELIDLLLRAPTELVQSELHLRVGAAATARSLDDVAPCCQFGVTGSGAVSHPGRAVRSRPRHQGSRRPAPAARARAQRAPRAPRPASLARRLLLSAAVARREVHHLRVAPLRLPDLLLRGARAALVRPARPSRRSVDGSPTSRPASSRGTRCRAPSRARSQAPFRRCRHCRLQRPARAGRSAERDQAPGAGMTRAVVRRLLGDSCVIGYV